MKLRPIVLLVLFLSQMTSANEVNILQASFSQHTSGLWSIKVTLKHDDASWKHYADDWRIVDEKGNILADRILVHPHINEQPFTRGLNNVKIPSNIKTVFIEAHDKVHGWSKNRLKVNLDDIKNGHLIVKAK